MNFQPSPKEFRVWSPDNKTMHYAAGTVDGLQVINPLVTCLRSEDFNPSGYEVEYVPDGISMQWTGLKDKNGTKIFEGDVVDVFGEKFLVFWETETASYSAYCINKQDLKFYLYERADKSTVVGNCFQNPKLMEATNASDV